MTLRHGHPPRRLAGFTLIELMVTLTVLAVVAMIAAPSFQQAALSSRLTSYANAFSASLKLARSEAIKRNATVTMCRSADGTSCAGTGSWEQGWIVFNDANANSTVDGAETRFAYEPAASPDYSITSAGGVYALNFKGSGMSATTETVTLCRASPTPGTQKRTIGIDATGRTSVARVNDATACP